MPNGIDEALFSETPSAAAELISSLTLEAEQRLLEVQKKLSDRIQLELTDQNRRLDALQNRMLLVAPQRQIQMLGMKLDDLETRLSQSLKTRLGNERTRLAHAAQRLTEHHPRNRIRLERQSLNNLEQRLSHAVRIAASAKQEHLTHLQKRLENSSLRATLKRGYAILKDESGVIVDSAQAAKPDDRITAQLHDGELPLKVVKGL